MYVYKMPVLCTYEFISVHCSGVSVAALGFMFVCVSGADDDDVRVCVCVSEYDRGEELLQVTQHFQ